MAKREHKAGGGGTSLERMHHLHQWAFDKPFAVAMIAHNAVMLATVVIPLVELIRKGVASRIVGKQGVDSDWLALYRDPRRVKEVVRKAMYPTGDVSATAGLARYVARRTPYALAEAEQMLDSLPPAAKPIVEQSLYWTLRTLYLDQCEAIAASLDDEDPIPQMDMDQAMRTPEMQFFVLVVLPSMLEYGESATRIYSRARRGDRQALSQLIRLDKSVLAAPELARHVKRFGMERDAAASEIIAKAYMDEPETAQTELSVKARLAAYAIESSRAIGWKLGPKDMREAFNACERDRTGNPKVKDLDLSEDDEGWRQALHRAKPFFIHSLRHNARSSGRRYGHLALAALVSDFNESEEPPAWYTEGWEPRAARRRGPIRRLCDWWQRLVDWAQAHAKVRAKRDR